MNPALIQEFQFFADRNTPENMQVLKKKILYLPQPLVRVSALFLPVQTPARFATKYMNFGVVLAHHGFSERRTSPEMMVRCV